MKSLCSAHHQDPDKFDHNLDVWARAFVGGTAAPNMYEPRSLGELLGRIPAKQGFRTVMRDLFGEHDGKHSHPTDAFAYLAATISAVDIGVHAHEKEMVRPWPRYSRHSGL